jgi:hypothetical protein
MRWSLVQNVAPLAEDDEVGLTERVPWLVLAREVGEFP